ncbi:MAG TPA: 30S ribosomal protein S16 [Planctomycetota bacterium]|nr:30S ribosomal protein S16 [Planctomycetota bacterium]
MVKIRLKRTGRRHRNSFRIVACDIRQSRDGKVLETLGSYDPEAKTEETRVRVKPERVAHWLSVGAQPTLTVVQLLKQKGIATKPERPAAKSATKPEAKS